MRDYVKAVLEDGDFEYGPEGQLAYEAFGEMLVQAPATLWQLHRYGSDLETASCSCAAVCCTLGRCMQA